MVNKILVVKDYNRCVGCPCRRYSEETDEARCNVTNEPIPEGVILPNWCPLKPFPPKLPAERGEYAQGWNDLLEIISE